MILHDSIFLSVVNRQVIVATLLVYSGLLDDKFLQVVLVLFTSTPEENRYFQIVSEFTIKFFSNDVRKTHNLKMPPRPF